MHKTPSSNTSQLGTSRLGTSKLGTTRLAASQGGQAVVEYVLVLVVAIALIGGVVWQLHDAFQQWGRSYFGNYIACLLETGELPSLGYNNSNQGSLCEQDFEDFSLAQGRPLIARTEGGSSPTPSSSSNTSSSRRDSSSTSKPPKSRRSRSSHSTDGARKGRSGGFIASSKPGTRGSSPQGLSVSNKSAARGSGGADGGSTKNQAQNSSSQGRGRVPSQSRFDTARGVNGGQLNNELDERSGGQVQALATGSLPNKNKNKLIAVGKRSPPPPDLNIEPIGIGGWLRYLLIAAILIVLLLVLGGQALKLSKSLEGEN